MDSKEKFDLEYVKPTSKGKACHMQVDQDLHGWILKRATDLDVTFRTLANDLLCNAIQEYIRVKKMPDKIRDRTK